MKIQILGTGCSKCEKLAERVEKTASESGIEFEIEKVKDINTILSSGVLMTPALVIDGEIKASGGIPSLEEIKTFLNVSKKG